MLRRSHARPPWSRPNSNNLVFRSALFREPAPVRAPIPLPPRREPPKSGIPRGPKRVWLRHRKFVRSHCCCVPGCEAFQTEFAHIRSAATAGTGLKPFDWHGVPLCRNHHREQHQVGQGTFEDRHGIDLDAIATELVRQSPDVQMKLAMMMGEGDRT